MVAVADMGTWDPAVLVALLVLVVGADLIEIDVKGVSLSGSFLGLVVAMAVLGPAQASALALVGTLVWAVRYRPRPQAIAINLANFATFPLIGGLVMHWV